MLLESYHNYICNTVLSHVGHDRESDNNPAIK